MNYTRPLYLTSPQMYGDDVKYIQTKLSSLGFHKGSIDGYFGPITKDSVIAFQRNVGLVTDGSCGPATWSKLFNTSQSNNSRTIKKIFIDPGHGGNDSGAVGSDSNGNQHLEKNIALNISLEQKRLFEQLGYEVYMSRSSDISVSLKERTDKPNSLNVDLFISNHINAGGGTGIEVWASAINSNSKSHAENILSKLCSDTPLKSRGIKTRTQSDGRDYFHVLRESKATPILIEYGFIDTKSDLDTLSNISMQNKLARLTVEAIHGKSIT